MKTNEIKEALRSKGLTYSIIADSSDLTVARISQVITRASSSKLVAEVIAKAIEEPVEEVFPEMFVEQIKRQQAVENLRQRLAS